MKYIIILLFTISNSIIAFGQTNDDENNLLKQLDTASSEIIKSEIYNELSEHFKYEYEKARPYAEKGLAIAKKQKHNELIALSLYNIGKAEYYHNYLYEAINYFQASMKYYELERDTFGICNNKFYIARMYDYAYETERALEGWKDALKWATYTKDEYDIAFNQQMLGLQYCKANQFDKGIKLVYKGYERAKANNIKLSPFLYHISNAYAIQGDYSKSKKYLIRAGKLLDFSENSFDYITNILLLGDIYLAEGQLDSAYTLFSKALLESRAIKHRIEISSLTYLVKVQMEFGDFKAANSYLSDAMNLFGDKKSTPDYISLLVLKSNIEIALKDYEKAKNAINEAKVIADKFGDKYHQIQLKNLLGNIETEKGQLNAAEILHQKALEEARQFGNNFLLISSINELAKVKNLLGQPSEAYNLASESLLLAKMKNYRNAFNDIYKILYESAANKKDFEAAYKYKSLYHAIQDSIFTIEKNKEFTKIENELTVNKTIVENNKLKLQKNKNQILTQQIIMSAVALIVLLLFLFGRSTRIKNIRNQRLEQKVAERTTALQIANKDLEQANYELRTFNYIASHDIKEPIRNIGSYVGLIFRKLPTELKENLGEYFDTIKRSTNQLYTLIEDFANYTTMSKNETIETKDVDLNLLIFDVVEQLEETLKKYNGQVLISELPTIKTVKSLLFNTLKNLIENGLKYNKSQNPTVNIVYNKTKITEVSGQAHHQIIISDNGIGIDKIYHEKIFEMFKRLHHRGAYEGSGIGLAIVKLSVEKLGGTINLESEEGKGSRFVIELPN